MAQRAEAGGDMGSQGLCKAVTGWGVLWRGPYGEMRPEGWEGARGG